MKRFWRRWLAVLIGLGDLAGSANAQPGAAYDLGAEVVLAHPPGEPAAWQIVEFSAQGDVVPNFPNANYENRPGFSLDQVSDKLNKAPRLNFPIRVENLAAVLQAKDPTHEWLPPEIVAPREGYQFILLHYRAPGQAFTVALHLQGETVTAPPATVSLQVNPPVDVTYRPTATLDIASLKAPATEAAKAALGIALAQGLVPGGALGDERALERELTARFRLGGVRDTGVNYSAGQREGRAVQLEVQPVYIPAKITIELANWISLEDQDQWDAASIERLRKKRRQRETDIRQELNGVLPAGVALATQPLVAEWQNSALGKKYSLVPLRYERDTLVLGASAVSSRDDYEATAGAAYGATDGLQGTGSFHFAHERRLHLKFDLDASSGAEADSFHATVQTAPAKPIHGWTLNTDADFESLHRDEAYFGAATANAPVRWKNWRGHLGLTASRGPGDPALVAGKWPSTFTLALRLVHTDDEFAADATLPPHADEPDSSAELKASWRTSTLLSRGQTKLRLGAQVRLSHALTTLNGNYDYRLAEGAVRASLVTGATAGRTWKITATTRAGRIDGVAPLATFFRAGGDDGWIRGLREGELIGHSYWAQSLAVGPEISAFFGDAAAGGPTAFLLAGCDYGEVQDLGGARHAARGYSLAVNLDAMPLAKDLTADLYLGYAYSPESRVDRHGAFFVRLDLPFGN
jgi:hypothetical protein